MRVRISYAVDSEELPEEIAALVHRAAKIADNVAVAVRDVSNTCYDDILSVQDLDEVISIRDQLIKLDSYLADVAQLILGQQQVQLRNTAERGQLKHAETANKEQGGDDLEELLEKTGELSKEISELEQADDL